MTTYQDVVAANQAVWAWAFVESSGLDFAPYIGGQHATGHGTFQYLQAGPFAASQSIKANTTGWVTVPFPTASGFWYVEFWIKIPTMPPASAANLFGSGTVATQSTGLYIATGRQVHFTVPGLGDFDTGYLWPDTNWHLVQVGGSQEAGNPTAFCVDGIQRYSHTVVGGTFPANSMWSFLGIPSGALSLPSTQLAMAAVYAGVMEPSALYASYIAATDPAAAMNYVRGGNLTATNTLLQQIYAAVHKTY